MLSFPGYKLIFMKNRETVSQPNKLYGMIMLELKILGDDSWMIKLVKIPQVPNISHVSPLDNSNPWN